MSISIKHAIALPVRSRRYRLVYASGLAAVLLASVDVGIAADNWSPAISGLLPDRRPEAPQIKSVTRSDAWYARALTGVDQPYPWSLQFLYVQGNWHSPFVEPGMSGRYDIRGWHREVSPLPAGGKTSK